MTSFTVLVQGFLLLSLFWFSLLREASLADEVPASTPPRGWNSYDSFSWIVSENEFTANALVMAEKLLIHGYEYAVVDFLWFRKREPGAAVTSGGHDLIDEWGRPVPDPVRWPSSKGGQGFKPVADALHSLGLKFGLHVMRGINQQAFNANTPILGPHGEPYTEAGKIWRARDIALPNDPCKWMPACFMSINTQLGAGKAFLRSLYSQYADWGVDFIKHDCVFGDDLNVAEIAAVSEILSDIGRTILYSVSPGTHATPSMAVNINSFVNMYRISADDWDSWSAVYSHFDLARDFASSGLIGKKGLLGYSWPDLDMLPFGWLTDPGVKQGPHRSCALTTEEQRTQMTLWAMAKSPLIYGGDLRNIDDTTLHLITNPTLLYINSFSANNSELSILQYTKLRGSTLSKEPESYLNSAPDRILKIGNCQQEGIRNWSTGPSSQHMKEVCWRGSLQEMHEPCICLHWRNQPNASLNWSSLRSSKQSRGHARMLASEGELCLDSSPSKQSYMRKLRSSHFSPCNNEESQDWMLMPDGALYNHYTGLCAHVYETKVVQDGDEARGWIASGPTGEIYLAVFNLGLNGLTISVDLKDVFILPSLRHDKMARINPPYNCSAFSVWDSKDIGSVESLIIVNVQSHDCALFILKCY